MLELTRITRFRYGGTLLVLTVSDEWEWSLLVLCESGTYWDNHRIACAMTKLGGEGCSMSAVLPSGADDIETAYNADRGQKWRGIYKTRKAVDAMETAMRRLQRRC